MGADLQAKLLRVVQDGEFERLGTAKTVHVNIRIIAATHRDLAERVKNGAFREDLLYRPNVFPIHIPPLRERPEDIPLLVAAFLRKFEKKMGKKIPIVPNRVMDVMRTKQIIGIVLPTLLFGLSGCAARVGPKNLAHDRFDYSSAITRSWKEQMLLNMVKLRYMDPPMFLDVQQVVQQYTLEGSGSLFAPGWAGDAAITPAASASGRWAESPTITYTPVSGEKFTKSLLQPVSPADLFSLVQSGWPIDAVFEIGVRSVNGLHASSRTELGRRAGDPDFYRVLSMLRELQESDSFGIRVEETKAGAGRIMVFRAHHPDDAMGVTSQKARELLHLSPSAEEFRLVLGAVPQDDKEIAMLTRSMMEILAEASAGVDIPASDVDEGRVSKMDAHGASEGVGTRFLIRVHSSTSKPAAEEAFTAVRYRNYWFWVDDRDLSSKRGLGFLMILFTLVESGPTAVPPVLSISKP